MRIRSNNFGMNMKDAFTVIAKEGVKGARQPFSLGFPGEYWNTELACLVVPVGGDHAETVLVSSSSDHKKYTVITASEWADTDSALMAAALVHEVINGYHRK